MTEPKILKFYKKEDSKSSYEKSEDEKWERIYEEVKKKRKSYNKFDGL